MSAMLLILAVAFPIIAFYLSSTQQSTISGKDFAESTRLRSQPSEAVLIDKSNKSVVGQRNTSRTDKDYPSANEIKEILVKKRNMIGNSTGLGEVSYLAKTSVVGQRTISRIDKDYPSADEIREILVEERNMIGNSTGLGEVPYLANVYELVYALIAAFQRSGVPIFVGFGSHMGARRHHGIIPFDEKDIDFQIFSLDEEKVLSIIRGVLQRKSSWLRIDLIKREFGFQYGNEKTKQDIFKHYIDFWLFDDSAQKIRCIGRHGREYTKRYHNGCERWYMDFHAHRPLIFDRKDYFPPLYQVFGSHKVPIPRTSRELETFQFSEEDWNTTCGAHRKWSIKQNKWLNIPRKERTCSLFYDKYPFVFKSTGSKEELKQGGVVMHRSNLTA